MQTQALLCASICLRVSAVSARLIVIGAIVTQAELIPREAVAQPLSTIAVASIKTSPVGLFGILDDLRLRFDALLRPANLTVVPVAQEAQQTGYRAEEPEQAGQPAHQKMLLIRAISGPARRFRPPVAFQSL